MTPFRLRGSMEELKLRGDRYLFPYKMFGIHGGPARFMLYRISFYFTFYDFRLL